MELVSIFINIGIVIFILIGYRQLDKNNRSLEKVKKYSSKVKEDLSVFIDEKSADIRNLAIEIKVNLKTHSEILKRMKDENDKLKQEFELVGEVKQKFQEYERVLKQLDQATNIVEENLRRIQDESGFVDKVGKQITQAGEKLSKVEKEIPSLHDAFSRENAANLTALKEEVLTSIRKDQEELKEGVQEADKRLQSYSEYITQLESQREGMTGQTMQALSKIYQEFHSRAQTSQESLIHVIDEKVKQVNLTAVQAKEKFEREFKVVEAKYERHLQEISSKGIKMEHDALTNLKNTIYENSKVFNQEIEKTFTELSGQVNGKSNQILTTIEDTRKKATDYQEEINTEIDTIKSTFGEKFSHLKQDVNSRIETFILSNREKQKSLTQELAGLNQFSEQKIAKFKTEFTKSIGEITADVSSFKSSYLDKLKDAALAGEEERDRLVHTINANIEDSKELLNRNIAALREDITAVDDLKSRIHERIGEIEEAFKIHNRDMTGKLDSFRSDVEAGIEQSSTEIETKVLTSLEKRLAEYEATSNYRIDKIEEINMDINKLEENVDRLLSVKKQEVSEAFAVFLTDAETRRKEEETKTRELITSLHSGMQALEQGLQELKTRAYDNVSEKLKVFEDDFFADLTNRNTEMDEKLAVWQDGVHQKMESISRKYAAGQQHLEEKYQKNFAEKLVVLKKGADSGIEKLKETIKGDIHGARTYATQLAGDVEKITNEIKARYIKMKETAGLENKAVEQVLKKIKQDVSEWKKHLKVELAETASFAEAGRQELEAGYTQNLATGLSELETKTSAKIGKLQEKIDGDFAGVRAHTGELASEINGICAGLQSGYLELKKRTNSENESMKLELAGMKQALEQWKEQLEENLSQAAASAESRRQVLETEYSEKLISRLGELETGTNSKIGELQERIKGNFSDVQSHAEELAAGIDNICTEIRTGYLNLKESTGAENQAMESVLEGMQQKLAEWRLRLERELSGTTASITARRQEMETGYTENLTLRLEDLEKVTREKIGDLEKKIGGDFAAVQTNAGELAAEVGNICTDIKLEFLNLKEGTAAENESMKQILAGMQEDLGVWRKRLEGELSGTVAATEARREEMEAEYAENLTSRLGELETKTVAKIEKLEEKIGMDFAGVRVHAVDLAAEVDKVCTEIRNGYQIFRENTGVEKQAMQMALDGMKRDLGEWKKQWQEQLSEVTEEANKERLVLESKYSERLTTRLNELEIKAADEIGELEEKIGGDFAGVQAHAEGLATEVEKINARIGEDYNQLKNKTSRDREEVLETLEEIRLDVTDWKNKLATDFSELVTSSTRERQQLEDEYNTSLEADIERLKATAGAQYQMLEKEFETDLAGIRERAEDLAGEMRKISGEVKNHYAGLQKNADQENEEIKGILVNIRLDVEDWKKKFKADIDSITAAGISERKQLKQGFSKELTDYQENVSGHLHLGEAKMKEWQAGLQGTLATRRSEMEGELAGFQTHMQEEIQKISLDFSRQREDLILDTNEERARMKSDLKDFSVRLAEFNHNLKTGSKATLEEFSQQYKELKADMLKMINEFREDVRQRISGFKNVMQESNNSITEIQKNNIQKFEGEYKGLREKLKQIERAQQNFADQTKLFDRADTLKNHLKASIEELKSNIAKLEPERQKMTAVETELNKTRKSAEEVNSKLVRFLSEKRRIDSMEKDFSKLIRISNDIGVKLENVNSTQDALQEVQVKLRELGKLENEVETKYDRLEKKRDLIETTSLGIDKNFQLLQDSDSRLKSLLEEYRALQPRVGELKKELGVLLKNKPKTDGVLDKLDKLDTVLVDIEDRMNKLQTAREWLSKTETRLENIGREAGEQVKLMQSIIKADASKSRGKGAPPRDKRETIIKLASQGWSVKEISRATNISQGEVELILELAPAKR